MSRPKPPREWFTPPEIAAVIGIRPEAVISRIRSGELLAVDFARPGSRRPRFRVRRSDLDDFLRRRSVCPEPPARPRPRRDDPAVTQYVR